MSQSYRLIILPSAEKQLKKMDKFDAKQILTWLYNNIEGSENPRAHGKGLTANRTGEWRYRIGNYRVLAEIVDERVEVHVFKIGHRRDVY